MGGQCAVAMAYNSESWTAAYYAALSLMAIIGALFGLLSSACCRHKEVRSKDGGGYGIATTSPFRYITSFVFFAVFVGALSTRPMDTIPDRLTMVFQFFSCR